MNECSTYQLIKVHVSTTSHPIKIMSGQASSPNGSFSNVAAGCTLREGSSRSSSSSNNNNNSNSNANNSGSGSSSRGGGGSGHQHNNNNNMTGSAFGTCDTNNTAGISSSSSSRSAARFSLDAYNNAPAGFAASSAAGGGSGGESGSTSPMQGVTSGESAGSIAHQNHPNNHRHHHGNAAYASSTSQYSQNYSHYPSSSTNPNNSTTTAGENGSEDQKSNHFHHYATTLDNHTTNGNKNDTTHYSQYSLPYPGELTVYSWGRGEDGQLGIGDTSDQDTPTYVDSLRGVGVKQIACGSGHTVVLTGEGEVYTWGRGDDGRLGHGDNGWKYVPRLTHSLTGQIVTHVTCGSYHTAAVSVRMMNRVCYYCAINGTAFFVSEGCAISTKSQMINLLDTNIIYTSNYPTQSNGDLFTWGGGMYGKLGHGNESGHSNPRRVEILMGLSIVDIACGSRHTAVVTNKGCLYT